MSKLAVLILTYNEQQHIMECIHSASFADEIIVVDSGSTDNTVMLLDQAGIKVIHHPMHEGFAAQRNFALQQTDAQWVMFLDADERITLELATEIKKRLQADPEISAFALPRRNHFLGKQIKHCGWYPDYSYRLMKREKVYYVGLVHEHLKIDGLVSKIKEPFEHFTYYSIEQYINKLNKYTTLAAADMMQNGKRANMVDIILRPLASFIKTFILRKGIMDGIEGFIISLLSAFYVLVKYSKLFYLGKKVQLSRNKDYLQGDRWM